MPVDRDSRSLSPRRLTGDDAPAGLRLSTAAGWNQSVRDWELMIAAGEGIGMVDPSDELIATAILLPYQQDVQWISMVLVDGRWQKRGIGTRLLKLMVELSPLPVVGLDATAAGKPVYQNLGFGAKESITRFARKEQTGGSPWPLDEAVADLSAERFVTLVHPFLKAPGRGRQSLLADLTASGDGRLALQRGEKTASLALTRVGREATQIGPLHATDAASATAILRSIASSRKGRLIIDVPDRHEAFVDQIVSLGFESSRHFTRMFKGGQPAANPTEYAIAGPEFG
jgi:GNAT superfamily N-acetyltransferase